MTSHGYPQSFVKNMKITIKGKSLIFISGAAHKGADLITTGGRVLSIVSVQDTLKNARKTVYKEINNVRFDGAHYRKDIGLI
jgi:phosphoribosylamine-glycine ligase